MDEHSETERVCGFRAAYVFDISQTDGQDLPELGTVRGNPETFHQELHRGDRRSISIVVCEATGLDTGTAANDYIQLWSGNAELLTDSLSYVQQAAAQILKAVKADHRICSMESDDRQEP